MFDKIAQQARNATLYSLDGMKYLLSSEFAARLEVYAFIWVLACLLFLQVSAYSLSLTLILFLVLLAVEALNTAIEVVIDRVSPEISDTGKHAKDLGSFSVMCLIAANFIHLVFVLSTVDWPNALESARQGWGALFISVTFLCVSLYFFTYSGLTKLSRLVFISCVGAYLIMACSYFINTPLYNASLYKGLDIIKFAIYILTCGAALIFINDLLGQSRYKLSQNIRQFVRRKIKVGTDTPHTKPRPDLDPTRLNLRKKNAALYGSLAMLCALLINPLTQDMARTILS